MAAYSANIPSAHAASKPSPSNKQQKKKPHINITQTKTLTALQTPQQVHTKSTNMRHRKIILKDRNIAVHFKHPDSLFVTKCLFEIALHQYRQSNDPTYAKEASIWGTRSNTYIHQACGYLDKATEIDAQQITITSIRHIAQTKELLRMKKTLQAYGYLIISP